MKTLSGIAIAILLIVVGFAAGFPVGKNIGFETGSEWALVQAKILAREADSFMPVYLADGEFRVVIKQPRHLYRNAWKLADRHDDLSGGVLTAAKPVDSLTRVAGNATRFPAILQTADQSIK